MGLAGEQVASEVSASEPPDGSRSPERFAPRAEHNNFLSETL